MEINKPRVQSLDWLRGLTAISIMTYHLCQRNFGQPDANSFIGVMGIYGVSIFFVLSGLSMAFVYSYYFTSIKSVVRFIIRRFFRILPLFWIAIILSVIFIQKQSGEVILKNASTLFGFMEDKNSIIPGGWSIGSEMFYYALTPLILWLYDKNKWIGNAGILIALYYLIDYAFKKLDPNLALGAQWYHYIEPNNNLFLYYSGIFLFYNFKERDFHPTLSGLLILLGLFIFLFPSTQGNLITTVIGLPRLLFCFAGIILVLGFYKWKIALPKIIAYPLEQFGIATYGIYLLHQIIDDLFRRVFSISTISNEPRWDIMLMTIVTTVFLSLFIYRFLEKPLIQLGKKCANFFR